ncbi:murein hydrolase activator EnvC family protein [Enterocloster sp.]|uniref:murein hydrolase activator EnvC family protein n=1 Tax=Enterocloster sp. TaxID=2719315 RepID=UPI003AB39243
MRKKKIAVLAAAAALTLGTVFSSYATSKAIEDAKKKVSSMEEEKKKAESTLKELEGKKSDTAAYVKELDRNLSALAGELTKLEGDISQKEEQIEEAKVELETAKITENRQYEDMKLRIQYMYENGQTGLLESMMQSESIAELLNRAEYASQITSYDRKMLEEYRKTRQEVALKEEALKTEHQELLTLQDSTKAKQSSVKTLMASKEAELASYETKIASAQGEIDQYNADIKAQEEHMARVEAEIRRKEEEARKAEEARRAEEAKKNQSSAGGDSTVKKGNTNFIWPCPASGRISSAFGDRSSPTEGASTNHKGIDIPAPSGSSIVAAADGKVVISTYSYSAGNYIMIDHGGGLTTVYMHCSQLLVKEGETVKQGQTIAKVGSTGYSTGPHLHFGVRSGGSYVNPSGYVSP